MKQKVVIIGAGLGGLFTGAILSKEGFEVTILEKNALIGGGLQTFQRYGEHFDTGMHIIGGMQPNGNTWRICRYLGILDKVNLRNVDDNCTDRLYFAEDKAYYTLAKGREGFKIADTIDLFNLRPSEGQINYFIQSEDFILAADDFIARHTNNKKLRSVLAYMNPLYGGRAHETPAYIHAIISTLYIEGESRFVDGSGHFAQLLADLITGLGGQVLPNKKIEWIEINDRKVDYVIDKDGQKHTADYYISDIHPCTLLQLTDEKAFPKSYRERLNSIPNTHSAFSLYIKLKPKSFPYLNYSEYYMTRYDDVWNII